MIYEVVWTRLLVLIMGATTYSISTVLVAFMGGLSLGSFLAGRYIDREKNPLRIYAFLEIAIGVYCLLLPLLLDFTRPLYQFLYFHFGASFFLLSIFRFLICSILLLIPTTMMGATLPILTRHLAGNRDILGRTVARLYGINTLGAFAGTILAGFALLALLGIRNTIIVAGCSNIIIGLLAWRLSFTVIKEEKKPMPEPAPPSPPLEVRLGIIAFAVSGFIAMVYQQVWTRVLILVIGSSTYAFSMILSSFIMGLALGGFMFGKIADASKRPLLVLAGVEIIIGISVLALKPVMGRLPYYIINLADKYQASFLHIVCYEFFMVFLLVLIPTVFLGGIFPLVSKITAGDMNRVGRSIGNIYAANCLGAIAGSFLGGFFFVPLVGMESSIYIMIGMNILLGMILLGVALKKNPGFSMPAIAGVGMFTFLLFFLLPHWDTYLLSAGTFYCHKSIKDTMQEHKVSPKEAVHISKGEQLYYKEGLETTVAVHRSRAGSVSLSINGKVDASTRGDAAPQLLMGYIPMFIKPGAEDVLIIGMGSGMTAGAVAQFPVKHIECLEISRAVIDANRFFSHANHDVLKDPRLQMIVGDGRNHVLLTRKKYDVIISQPSNPWLAGIASLFTREYFESCKDRLTKDGIMCQWVHDYYMKLDDFKMIIKTFSDVFPYCQVWYPEVGGDYIIIGGKKEFHLNYEHIRQAFYLPVVRKDMEFIRTGEPAKLLGQLLVEGKKIKDFCRGAAVNTDDNMRLEFSAPRAVYQKKTLIIMEKLLPYIEGSFPFRLDRLPGEPGARAYVMKQINRFKRSQRLKFEADLLKYCGKTGPALQKLTEALLLDPYDIPGRRNVSQYYMLLSKDAYTGKELTKSIAHARKALELTPENSMIHLHLAEALFQERRYEESVAEYKKIMAGNPEYTPAINNLAWLYATADSPQFKDREEAIRLAQKAVALDNKRAQFYDTLAEAYAGSGLKQEALAASKNALENAGENMSYFEKRLVHFRDIAR